MQPLLRRLRGRGRDRDARHRAGQGALRRRARQRAASLGLHGQPGRLLGRARAGRPRPGHEPGPRRPSHSRPRHQLLRPGLHLLPLRGRARRPAASTWTRCAPRRSKHKPKLIVARRERLSRASSTSPPSGPSPTRWAPSSWPTWPTSPGWWPPASHPSPVPALRVGHHHHAQDAGRPARRRLLLPGGGCGPAGQGRLPRPAGRAARARHRRQGGVLPAGGHRGVQGEAAAHGGERPGAGRRRSWRAGSSWSRAAPTTTSCWSTSAAPR